MKRPNTQHFNIFNEHISYDLRFTNLVIFPHYSLILLAPLFVHKTILLLHHAIIYLLCFTDFLSTFQCDCLFSMQTVALNEDFKWEREREKKEKKTVAIIEAMQKKRRWRRQQSVRRWTFQMQTKNTHTSSVYLVFVKCGDTYCAWIDVVCLMLVKLM